MSSKRLGYWAVIEHAKTWPKDEEILNRTRSNGGFLSVDDAKKVARDYKFARTFRGVAKRGYAEIVSKLNGVDILQGQTIQQRLARAEAVTREIANLDYSLNPSGISKWLWFRAPDNWYIYDQQAAAAVGAERSTLTGMKGFYAILHACDVQDVHDKIRSVIDRAGATFRAERIIDKFLWLKGDPEAAEKAIAQAKVHSVVNNIEILDLAEEIFSILPDDRFDFSRVD